MGFGSILGAGAGLLGIGLQNTRRKQAVSDSKELMGLQVGHQERLNKQGQELGMKTWNETNYGPQMEKMKEAGLNPALMYGMSGGGGSTVGSPSGGGASGGNAPAPQQANNAMDVGLKMAQVELMKAQTEKTKAEARNVGTVDANLKNNQAYKALEETEKLRIENRISNKVWKTRVEKEGAELVGIGLENYMTQTKTTLTEEQIRQVKHKIIQDWVNSGSIAIGSLGTVITNAVKNMGKK